MARPARLDDIAWVRELDDHLWHDGFLSASYLRRLIVGNEPDVYGFVVSVDCRAYCVYRVIGGRFYLAAVGCESLCALQLVVTIQLQRGDRRIFTHLIPDKVPRDVAAALRALGLEKVRRARNTDLLDQEPVFDLEAGGFWLYETPAG